MAGTSTTSSYLLSKSTDVCSPPGGDNDTLAVVAVLSASEHYEHRSAVRATWGGVLTTMPGFKVVFMLGRPHSDATQNRIVREDAEHDDIVQGNFLDTYRNLTLKSLMMLRWTNSFCPNTRYLLKIDDDVLLNVWDFVITLYRLAANEQRRTIWGTVISHARPARRKKGRYGKWYVPTWMYAKATYPDYVNGPAYVISGDSVPLLLRSSSEVPYFYIEDVYLTGLVAEKAGIRRVNDRGYVLHPKRNIRPCQNPRVVVSHGWNPRNLRSAWRKMAGRINRTRCRSLGLQPWQEGVSE
ncbi:lactosylceramide 1,3-N-acetyl-beta-D-glucosaminyltransferase-like [Rhipicephalus microplus]|uniref:lactosylceramide 1,3-N-acetyl-beta-D-glucosaminyltransferase-like n=1 Tax=Rhipicephalus microplus TaxID=6941 RepID=UPI003F6AFA32